KRAEPLGAAADRVSRHALTRRQRFARAVRGHGAERLIVALRAAIDSRLPGAGPRIALPARRDLTLIRVVRLQRRAVLAILAKQLTADDDRRPASRMHADR